MGLTDVSIRKMKPQERPVRRADGMGLYIEVTPSGGKLWRWAYRFDGKQKLMALGTYPEVSLAEARERHQEWRRFLGSGIDPMLERKIEKARMSERQKGRKRRAKIGANTDPEVEVPDATEAAEELTPDSPFRALALHWFDHWKTDKAPKYVKRTRSRLDANLFPSLADLPLSRIEPKDVIRMVKAVESRGVKEVCQAQPGDDQAGSSNTGSHTILRSQARLQPFDLSSSCSPTSQRIWPESPRMNSRSCSGPLTDLRDASWYCLRCSSCRSHSYAPANSSEPSGVNRNLKESNGSYRRGG